MQPVDHTETCCSGLLIKYDDTCFYEGILVNKTLFIVERIEVLHYHALRENTHVHNHAFTAVGCIMSPQRCPPQPLDSVTIYVIWQRDFVAVIRVYGLENSEITLYYPRGSNLNTESGRAENFLGLEVERNVAEGGSQRACKHAKDFPGCCWL